MPKKDSQLPTDNAAAPTHAKLAALWSYPDAAKLAHLVAQPRFAPLSDEEAIRAALLLIHKCQAAINEDSFYWDEQRKIEAEYEGIRKPGQFPATLTDFFRLIVRGKDEGDNYGRYRGWCKERSRRLAGFAVSEDRYDYFNKRKKDGFLDEHEWYFEALGYLDYWKCKRQEDKRRAGRARQNKYRRNKKAPQAS